MLVLTRKVGERVVIDGDVVLTVLSVDGSRIRLGIEAPPSVNIRREELLVQGSRGALVGVSEERRPDRSWRPPPKG